MASIKYIQRSEVKFGQKLGDGGFGFVQKGVYNGQNVAIKTIMDKFDTEFAQREPIYMLQFDDNEFFPRIYGVIKDNDKEYSLVMELVEGGSLASVIRSIRPTLPQVISWLTQAAMALAELHSNNIVHRDIKGSNMLLDKELKKLKIGDFGLVRKENTIMTNDTGTRVYMAPEVFKGNKYSRECDVFSFGITIWEVLSGLEPYYNIEELSSDEFFKRLDRGLRPSLEDVRTDCPQSIKDLMEQCWKRDPKRRPTMQEVVAVLSKE